MTPTTIATAMHVNNSREQIANSSDGLSNEADHSTVQNTTTTATLLSTGYVVGEKEYTSVSTAISTSTLPLQGTDVVRARTFSTSSVRSDTDNRGGSSIIDTPIHLLTFKETHHNYHVGTIDGLYNDRGIDLKPGERIDDIDEEVMGDTPLMGKARRLSEPTLLDSDDDDSCCDEVTTLKISDTELYDGGCTDEDDAIARQHRVRLRLEEGNRNKRRLQRVMTLCFAFFLIEIIGGLTAGSLALMSDAFHLLSGK